MKRDNALQNKKDVDRERIIKNKERDEEYRQRMALLEE